MLEQALIYRGNFDFKFHLRSYGVTVRIESNNRELLEDAKRVAQKALAGGLEIFESENVSLEYSFGLAVDEEGNFFLFRNGEQFTNGDSRYLFLKFFNSMLRIAVAEHASSHVFIHSGVVSWGKRALLLPANSFQGKTTLVAELVKCGAEYYSDEYAVLDADGRVNPFPRDLSVRYFDEFVREKEVPVSSFGGIKGIDPIPVGLVLLTEYQENADWAPQMLSTGKGIIEIVPHTIPVRANTEFSLKVLNKALSRAIIAKSPRGDAAKFAGIILSFFDECMNTTRIP